MKMLGIQWKCLLGLWLMASVAFPGRSINTCLKILTGLNYLPLRRPYDDVPRIFVASVDEAMRVRRVVGEMLAGEAREHVALELGVEASLRGLMIQDGMALDLLLSKRLVVREVVGDQTVYRFPTEIGQILLAATRDRVPRVVGSVDDGTNELSPFDSPFSAHDWDGEMNQRASSKADLRFTEDTLRAQLDEAVELSTSLLQFSDESRPPILNPTIGQLKGSGVVLELRETDGGFQCVRVWTRLGALEFPRGSEPLLSEAELQGFQLKVSMDAFEPFRGEPLSFGPFLKSVKSVKEPLWYLGKKDYFTPEQSYGHWNRLGYPPKFLPSQERPGDAEQGKLF